MQTAAAPHFSGNPQNTGPTLGWRSSSEKNGTSDGSLDIDAFLDNMLMRDPIRLGTELVPSALAQGLSLATEASQGQQGSNGRKQGSGSRLPILMAAARTGPGPPLRSAAPKPAEEPTLPPAGQAAADGNNTAAVGTEVGGNPGPDLPCELVMVQQQAAAAGAAAAQAMYAQQQQHAATAMAAAAQAYSQQQQQEYAQQAQHAAARAAAAGIHRQPVDCVQQVVPTAAAQAQQAAYAEAYHQQAAAYAAACGQYPPPGPQYQGSAVPGQYGGGGGWMATPYGYAYYAPQQAYHMQAYQSMSMPPSAAMMQQQQQQQPTAGAAAVAAATEVPEGEAAGGNVGGEEGDDARALKRPRLIWTNALHKRFLEAVKKCGGLDRALPKAIMTEMKVSGLTRENVASHLQKHRMRLKRGEVMDDLEDDEEGGAVEDGGEALAAAEKDKGKAVADNNAAGVEQAEALREKRQKVADLQAANNNEGKGG